MVNNGESTNFGVLVVQPSTSNLAGEQTSAPSYQFQRQKRPIPKLISISKSPKSRKGSLATSIIMQRLSQRNEGNFQEFLIEVHMTYSINLITFAIRKRSKRQEKHGKYIFKVVSINMRNSSKLGS